MPPLIVVVGSSNTDMVIKADHLPAPGETILGGTFFTNPGGKGANQAVSAARLGGNVMFIAKTGDDIFGKKSFELFKQEGIDTSYIIADPGNVSGVALITVDKTGENCIVVAPGANAALTPADVQIAKEKIEKAAILLIQLEIPIETVQYVVTTAASKKITVVLNPAPFCPLSDDLLRNISIITPNKTEAEMLTGIKINNDDDAKQAAQYLYNKGIPTVIITMGSRGALVFHKTEFTFINARPVKAVDTTAAGDIFNGALAVALAEGSNMIEAVNFACNAASVSVTRIGAQSSAPYKNEMIDKLIKEIS